MPGAVPMRRVGSFESPVEGGVAGGFGAAVKREKCGQNIFSGQFPGNSGTRFAFWLDLIVSPYLNPANPA